MAGWTLDSGQYVSNTQNSQSTCLTTANTLFTFGEGGACIEPAGSRTHYTRSLRVN